MLPAPPQPVLRSNYLLSPNQIATLRSLLPSHALDYRLGATTDPLGVSRLMLNDLLRHVATREAPFNTPAYTAVCTNLWWDPDIAWQAQFTLPTLANVSIGAGPAFQPLGNPAHTIVYIGVIGAVPIQMLHNLIVGGTVVYSIEPKFSSSQEGQAVLSVAHAMGNEIQLNLSTSATALYSYSNRSMADIFEYPAHILAPFVKYNYQVQGPNGLVDRVGHMLFREIASNPGWTCRILGIVEEAPPSPWNSLNVYGVRSRIQLSNVFTSNHFGDFKWDITGNNPDVFIVEPDLQLLGVIRTITVFNWVLVFTADRDKPSFLVPQQLWTTMVTAISCKQRSPENLASLGAIGRNFCQKYRSVPSFNPGLAIPFCVNAAFARHVEDENAMMEAFHQTPWWARALPSTMVSEYKRHSDLLGLAHSPVPWYVWAGCGVAGLAIFAAAPRILRLLRGLIFGDSISEEVIPSYAASLRFPVLPPLGGMKTKFWGALGRAFRNGLRFAAPLLTAFRTSFDIWREKISEPLRHRVLSVLENCPDESAQEAIMSDPLMVPPAGYYHADILAAFIPAVVFQVARLFRVGPFGYLRESLWTYLIATLNGLAAQIHPVFATIFVGPVLEELLTRAVNLPRLWISSAEFALYMVSGVKRGIPPPTLLKIRTFMLFVHQGFAALPAKYALPAHMLWNAIILTLHTNFQASLSAKFVRVLICSFLLIVLIYWTQGMGNTIAKSPDSFRAFIQTMQHENMPDNQQATLVEHRGPTFVQLRPLESSVVLKAPDATARVSEPAGIPRNPCKVGTTSISIVFSCRLPSVFASSENNERVSLYNRQIMAKGVPNEDVIQEWKTWVIRAQLWINPMVGGLVRIAAAPFEVWVARYSGTVKAKMVEAKARLDEGNLTQMRVAQAFVKVEHSSNTTELGTPNKDPRNITSPCPEIHVLYGPWYYAASKHLMRHWEIHHEICYASGLHAEDIGHWWAFHSQRFQTFRMYKGDASRADGNQTAPLMEARYQIYHAMGLVRPVQSRYRAVSKNGIRVSVAGTQASGNSDTSFGNTLTHALVPYYIVRKQNRRCSIISMGDDVFIIVEGPEEVDFSQYAQFAMKVEMIEVTDPYDIEFCSGLLWPVADFPAAKSCEHGCHVRHVWGPKPGRILPKLGWTTTYEKVANNVNRHLRGWYLGIHKSVSMVPFVTDVVERIGALVPHVQGAEPLVDEHKFKVRYKHSPDIPEMVALIDHRYGLDYAACVTFLRQELQRVNSLPYVVHWTSLQTLNDVDV